MRRWTYRKSSRKRPLQAFVSCTSLSRVFLHLLLVQNKRIYMISIRFSVHGRLHAAFRDELIRDVLLWTPTHGRAKAGRPARTYIQQLCEDTGCCPEDLPRAMNDREEWRERVRDIRATRAIWWYIYIYVCVCVCVCANVYIYIYIYIYIYT